MHSKEQEKEKMLKEHEKFIAFCLLGFGLIFVAGMVYLHPLSDSQANSGATQILNTIVGALTLAFGGAANALFRVSDQVKVSNAPDEPVPVNEPTTTAAAGELPEQEKIDAKPVSANA